MIRSDETQRHRQEETGANQARGCWRRNVEEAASRANDQSQNESD
jgi:hypothetical protein